MAPVLRLLNQVGVVSTALLLVAACNPPPRDTGDSGGSSTRSSAALAGTIKDRGTEGRAIEDWELAVGGNRGCFITPRGNVWCWDWSCSEGVSPITQIAFDAARGVAGV